MAALNQGKIIKALETLTKGSREDFIWDFLKAYGTPLATIKRLRLGDTQRNVARIAGDLAVNQKLYFRAVQAGSSLHEAMREIREQPILEANRIRFILVTDFQTVLAYDSKVDDSTEFPFAEFPANYEFFLPMTGLYEKAVVYAEHPADTKACEKMGRLYDSIRTINHYEKDDLHTLNVFLTRLLFCFFAEDTGIFPIEHQMTTALQSNTLADGSDVADFFSRLFAVLDLPMDSEERRHYPASLQAFPYVNGDLFREKSRIPDFDAKTRRLLIDCGSMRWSDISPVIFGSMFQAVMDPEARRSLGAHYTSEKNILKLVRPLFLDGLEEEFQQILALNRGRLNALKEFQKKLGSLGFLDPACGCGNFLIVSYRELRELELRVLLAMREISPRESQWMDVSLVCKVNIGQFYGIEIEEFPVDVAHVSMVLMEHVMNRKVGESFGQVYPSIPLKHAPTIVCANALTTPWEDVVAPEKLNYILGNPPFSGARIMKSDSEQKAEIKQIFENSKGSENLDYVTGWFKKASDLIANSSKEAAFVATNSICQGEQVGIIWKYLTEHYNIKINFAHRTFRWSNEAKNNAAIHCVIVGISSKDRSYKVLFDENGVSKQVNCIGPYLTANSEVYVEAQKNPFTSISKMNFGNQPRDGGNFILSNEEKEKCVADDPTLQCWIRRYMGAEEFINGVFRWCFWFKGITSEQIRANSKISEVVEKVYKFRRASAAKTTNGYAKVPMLFAQITQPDNCDFLLVPCVSSERRKYIPIGFLHGDIIASNAVQIVPNATHYDFAILTSAMHMAWMRTVCGRLEMRYRYSRDLCYNTFPWPTITEAQKKEVEALAEEVLMAREMYPDRTLAEMYDPDKMPAELQKAHHNLDLAVDALYRKKPFENDDERLQVLFDLYEKLVRKGQ